MMDEEAKLRAISTAAMEEVRRSYNQDSDVASDSAADINIKKQMDNKQQSFPSSPNRGRISSERRSKSPSRRLSRSPRNSRSPRRKSKSPRRSPRRSRKDSFSRDSPSKDRRAEKKRNYRRRRSSEDDERGSRKRSRSRSPRHRRSVSRSPDRRHSRSRSRDRSESPFSKKARNTSSKEKLLPNGANTINDSDTESAVESSEHTSVSNTAVDQVSKPSIDTANDINKNNGVLSTSKPFRSRSNSKKRSHSRSRSRSNSRRRSRSPSRRKRSRSPVRRRSRSRSPSRRGSRAHSPSPRRRSRSPKRRSRSPRRRSRSPRRRSRSPRRRRSPGRGYRRGRRDNTPPRRRYSRSPPTRRNRESRSPSPYWGNAKMKKIGAKGRSPSPTRYDAGSGFTRAVLPSQSKEKKERVVTSEDIEARLAKHMEEIKAKAAEEAKKINLPGYLNPAMVNVAQFKQVQEKRKLLWSKAKNKEDGGKWAGAFNDDSDDGKFRRLMGIHGETAQASSGSTEQVQKSRQVLEDLEREYQKSQLYHLSRGAGGVTGIGLGFGSGQAPNQ